MVMEAEKHLESSYRAVKVAETGTGRGSFTDNGSDTWVSSTVKKKAMVKHV